MEKNKYNIIIAGGGAAGVTAAVYAHRANMKCVIIESATVGGQIASIDEVENFPSYTDLNGMTLSIKMQEQVEKLGIEIIYDTIKAFDLKGEIKRITLSNGQILSSDAVILAMGAKPRKLNVENEDKFIGAGVSYCATCDGAFFKKKTVAVAGFGNRAVSDAIYLSKLASKVYIINRLEDLRINDVLSQKIKEFNIEVINNSRINKLNGDIKLQSIDIIDTINKETRNIALDGVFVLAGREPSTYLVMDSVKIDDQGYIITDNMMATNIDGVYAAGDIIIKPLRQIITAMSDGAIAGEFASRYISQKLRKIN
jgi:thioredoxin reductase (NADPH)